MKCVLLIFFFSIQFISLGQSLSTSFDDQKVSEKVFDKRRLCCSYSTRFDSTIVADGKYSLRIELNKNDEFYRDNGDLRKKAKKRAEIGTLDNVDSLLYKYGKEYWYSFRVYIPESWVFEDDIENEPQQNRDIISQWHWKKEDLDESGKPALAITVNGSVWTIFNSYQTDESLDKDSEISSDIFGGNVEKGKWVKWTVNARWSNDENEGFLKIWKDDYLIMSLKGANCNKDRDLIYKFGIYKPRWTSRKSNAEKRVIYFDEIKISTTPLN